MIVGREINLVTEELSNRNCLLYHACHLKDLVSYLDVGGIPSRQLLETQNKPFTSFYTDEQDRTDGVFEKVFLNLSDFGNTFNNGSRATPLIYGPILLAISPHCLRSASDIAVCLRSAGSSNYNRATESLNSHDDFIKIFRDLTGKKIKTSAQLQTSFPGHIVGGQPEISCTFGNQKIPFNYLRFAVVDPLIISENDLQKITQGLFRLKNIDKKVFQRICSSYMTKDDYQEVYNLATEHLLNFNDIAHRTTSQHIREWAQKMDATNANNRSWSRFKLYQQYYKEGTFNYIIENLQFIRSLAS